MASQKEVCRRNINEMIRHLCKAGAEHSTDIHEGKLADVKAEETSGVALVSPVTEDFDDADIPREDEEEGREVLIESSMFDDLEWEVDCSAEVWKFFRDHKFHSSLKQRSISKILRIAKGDWSQSLCKPLAGAPANIKLFEAKLSRGCRIIWELAIDFSSKLSENPERRLTSRTGEQHGADGGRIYSEIIRVWDIVLDHDKIHHSVAKIAKSHERGRECIINKKLKGLGQNISNPGNYVTKHLPRIFTEQEEATNKSQSEYFPPASSNEIEFHILKFYSVDSSFIQRVLRNKDIVVDVPFKVGELEHAIINLRPEPPSPILLLGRSGTGKTICCLYRLFADFLKFWECANLEESPSTSLDNNDQHNQAHKHHEGEATYMATMKDYNTDTVFHRDLENTGAESNGIHQIFVTKSGVLSCEVQKKFHEMSQGLNAARQHLQVRGKCLPMRLQDAHQAAYPFFLTCRQFLMILDASVPPPFFFDRKDDFSLKREVKGWMEDDGPLISTPDVVDNLEEDNEDEDLEEMELQEAAAVMGQTRDKQAIHDPWREVTYEMFVSELWPKMQAKVKVCSHPTLVWMEITSFIQGSVEALNTLHGYLSCQEYKMLGRKRASNFTDNKDVIYRLFQHYRQLKKQMALFDEGDVVFNLYQRLKKCSGNEWVIHQFFVDETQDFTQAELFLLIQCCQNPNHMFLAGDTAQSIMRGISFRFEDLKSLFYYAQQATKALGKTADVEIPKLYQLTHNYRTHAGILRLASSVVDILTKFFPESFDELAPDQALFDGPKPSILQSCSIGDLALILQSSLAQTSRIEFGAHQAILVVDSTARDNLPEELRLGLVLTIFESKGLEFDNILLYNFFSDSQAHKEWRIVTGFLHSLLKGQTGHTSTPGALVQLDEDSLKHCIKSKPLQFDQDRHKVLISELKRLYTALTRARGKVWIFDEDVEASAPMYEYFKARQLVDVLVAEDINCMVIHGSSLQEWQKRGDELFRQKLYKLAAKCYIKSGDKNKMSIASARQHAHYASRLDDPRCLRAEFLFAAKELLQCGLTAEAIKCLNNAREFMLVAKLYEKLGKFQHASVVYMKLGKIEKASRAFENGFNFGQAVEVLVNVSMFDKAIDAVERYHITLKKYKDSGQIVPGKLLSNRPSEETYSVKRLSLLAARFHYDNYQRKAMLAALDRLPNPQDRINFLLDKGLMDAAAPIMRAEGRGSEIALRYYQAGRLEMALKYADADEELRGKCLLPLARQTLAQHTDLLNLKPTQNTTAEKVPCPDTHKMRGEHSLVRPPSTCSHPTVQSEVALRASSQTLESTQLYLPASPHSKQMTSTTDRIENKYTAASDGTSAEAVPRNIKGLANSLLSKVFDTVDNKAQESQEQQATKSVEQEHDDPEVAKAKKYLLEAITLFAGRDDVSSGEAKLLLGTLMKDPGLLREALKHFEEHHAGYVACIDVLGRLNNRIFSEDHGHLVIIALGRVLKLLAILNSLTTSLNDRKQLDMFYCFHGLQQTIAGKLKVMQKEGSRIATSFSRVYIGLETDEEMAKSVMRDILLTKASLWVQSVSKSLRQAIIKNQQCTSYVVGRRCTVPNCSMLHQSHDRTTYGNLLRSLLAMIKLNSMVEKSLMESKGSLKEDINTITTNEPWKWCDELYHAMYPHHAHPTVLASDDTIPRLVLRDIRQESVKWFVLKYVEKKWKEADSLTRQADTDFLLKIHSLLCLVGEKHQRLGYLLVEEEREYTNQAKQSPEAFQRALHANLGFWIHGGSHKDVICYTYLGNFHKAIEQIHGKDPIKGLARLIQFFGFIIKKHQAPLIPSFANTVRLMEIMTVLIAALQLRTYKGATAILPASYLAAVNCWNAELEGVFDSDLYSSIQNHKAYKPQALRSVWGRARYVVMIMCGEASHYYDVIREAFDAETWLETGEAERVLVLALVLLVNSGGDGCILSYDCVGMLKRAIGRIQVTGAVEEVPRLATVLKQVKVANNRHEVIAALWTLLRARDREYLHHCTWKWQTHGIKGIYPETITSLNKISNRTYLPSSEDEPSQQFETSSTAIEMTMGATPNHAEPSYEEIDLEDQSSPEMSHQEMERARIEQEKRKLQGEKAAIIQRAYRAYLEKKQKQRRLQEKNKVSGKQGLLWKDPD